MLHLFGWQTTCINIVHKLVFIGIVYTFIYTGYVQRPLLEVQGRRISDVLKSSYRDSEGYLNPTTLPWGGHFLWISLGAQAGIGTWLCLPNIPQHHPTSWLYAMYQYFLQIKLKAIVWFKSARLLTNLLLQECNFHWLITSKLQSSHHSQVWNTCTCIIMKSNTFPPQQNALLWMF